MRDLQMVDLINQHNKIRKELDKEIADVINHAAFIKGEKVNAFERELAEYLGVKHVIACGNGTDALQAAFMALDLPEGSEVIVPDFTFIATAEVLALLKLKPVFVDVDSASFNLDPAKVRKAISNSTKAIVPVHMFGLPCEMDEMMAIANEYDLHIVEDVAQGLGSSYKGKKTGTFGEFGCTSFFPSKNLSCMGDGGAIFTNDDELGQKAREMCNHGMSQQYSYAHVGMNSRLDGLQAAILRVKLRHLDEYNEARQVAAERYDKGLNAIEAIELPGRNENTSHIFHQYTLKIQDDSRDELMDYLNTKGIPTKVYYPIPFHAHPPYKGYRYDEHQLNNSIWLSDHVLSLPMHTELDEDQQEFIIDEIKAFYS